MGHESPIEPWLAPDNRAACGLQTDWLRYAQVMKTAGKENQTAAGMEQRPEITERKATTILLDGVGWKPRKNPAVEEVFFP